MEQKNTNRARVKVAVFFVLAVHAIGLMALLMQGCRKEDPMAQQQAADTNTVAASTSSAPPPSAGPDTSLPAAPAVTGSAAATPATTGAEASTAAAAAAPAATATASDYTVVQGDNFWTIGKKFSVTSKAIADANPGVDPAKLKIGQKLHIPASVAKATTGTAATTMADASTGDQTYTVKSGDNLLKIAGQYHTTVKAIRSANSLATDRITVGQKLKIPKGSTTALPTTATTTSPTSAIPSAPESAAAVTSAAPVVR